MSKPIEAEVIVVGAGIAGASLAYFLACRGRGAGVVILEREEQPAVHSTGRSAAMAVELHHDPIVRSLIHRGVGFLESPPADFAEAPVYDPVGVLAPAEGAAWTDLRRFGEVLAAEGITVAEVSPDDVIRRVPVLERARMEGALCLPGNGHIDVHGLLSGYLARARRAGAELRCNVEVKSLAVERGRCVGVETNKGPLRARWVAIAAGAWSGALSATAAGAAPIDLQPRRRTAISFAAPTGVDPRRWPVVDCDWRGVYFKHESGGFLASPMDQEPSVPCDAAPTEEAVADAIEKLRLIAPAIVPGALRRKWAGLRTFAPDERPVVGPDPRLPGLFWVAGQGGVGIETSPVLGDLAAAALIEGKTADDPLGRALSPARFERP